MKKLIAELNEMLAHNSAEFAAAADQRQYVIDHLDAENAKIYASLPLGVARQLTLDRDPHGNVQVSLIETEKLLSEMVARRLEELRAEGKYAGKFAAMHHSSAMKDVAHSRRISMPTIATASVSRLRVSSTPV